MLPELANTVQSFFGTYVTSPLRAALFIVFTQPFRVITGSPYPSRLLLQLLRPYPLYFPLPVPLSPASILSNPLIVEQRMNNAGLPESRYIWPFYIRDTPLRCLYRIYEWASIDRPLQVGYETQYFWDQTSWKVEDIPDPKDPDAVRYAVLASFAETMAICFNERIDSGFLRMGNDGVTNPHALELRRSLSSADFIAFTKKHHEKAPSWVAGVRGPEQLFKFQSDVYAGEIFIKRNIEICGGGNMDWI
jgi:hypothetical protein